MAKKSTEKSNDGKASFLTEFNRESAKMEGIALSSPAPKYWLNLGNYCINKVMSGSYSKGIPTGRLASLAGPSGAGKSFLAGNAIKWALSEKQFDCGVLVIDSENALDDGYLTKIGADVIDNPLYNYRGVATISQTVNLLSKFVSGYKKTNEDMPFLVVVDSIDQLMTDSELEQYENGEIKGDQGQHAKQIKAMLKRIVNDLKGTNIALLSIKQVYKEQDKIAAFSNPWVLNDAYKFAFSQIGMVTKLMLKDDKTKLFEGITLKVRGEKTRFCKPFQTARIEVPYDAGMDPYSGILDASVALGIVEKNGGWYTFGDSKFQERNFDKHRDEIFAKVIEKDSQVLNVEIEEDEDTTEVLTAKELRLRKMRDEIDDDANDDTVEE